MVMDKLIARLFQQQNRFLKHKDYLKCPLYVHMKEKGGNSNDYNPSIEKSCDFNIIMAHPVSFGKTPIVCLI